MDELIRLMLAVLPEGEGNPLNLLKLYSILCFISDLMKKPDSGWHYCFGPLVAHGMAGCEPELGPMGQLPGKRLTNEWKDAFTALYNFFSHRYNNSMMFCRFAEEHLACLFPYGRVQAAVKKLEQGNGKKRENRIDQLWKQVEILWICGFLYFTNRKKSEKLSVIYQKEFKTEEREKVEYAVIEAAWTILYCYLYRYKAVETSKNMQDAVQLMEQAGLKKQCLPEIYYDAHKSLPKDVAKTWEKAMNGDIQSSKHTIIEYLCQAAQLLQRISPTTFSAEMDYRSGAKNISGVECGLITDLYFRRAEGAPKGNNYATIINPSPFFLNYIVKTRELKVKPIDIYIENEKMTDLLRDEYRDRGVAIMCTNETIERELPCRTWLCVLSGYGMERQRILDILKYLHDKGNRPIFRRLVVVLPEAYFKDKDGVRLREYLVTNFHVDQAFLLCAGEETGKVLILELSLGSSSQEYFYIDTVYVKYGNYEYIELNPARVLPTDELLKKDKTIAAIAAQRANEPEKREKRLPQQYRVSDEICIWYSSYQRPNGSITLKFSYCEFPTKQQAQRNPLSRGKCLAKKTVTVKSEKLIPQMAETVVFSAELQDEIIKSLERWMAGKSPDQKEKQKRKRYKKRCRAKHRNTDAVERISDGDSTIRSISLKSFWFMVRPKLLKEFRNGYDDEFNKQVFCGLGTQARMLSSMRLPDSNEETLREAVELIAEELKWTENEILRFWEQLHLIMRCAVDRKLYGLNPVDEFIQKNRRERADKWQRYIRDGLGKKALEKDEEKCIIDWLKAQLPENPAALGVLIRLYLGIPATEVAAFLWGDIKGNGIAGDRRQFVISKELRNGATEPEYLSNENKFRRVPIPIQLDRILEEQFQWLKQQTQMDENELLKCPILCIAKNPTEYLPVRQIHSCSKQAIEMAGIKPFVLQLPGAEGKKTDITRYGGDIFRYNLRYHAIVHCGLKASEIAYLLGNQMPDTYSKHYCDYTNPFIQLQICKKLERWWVKQEERAKFTLPSTESGKLKAKQKKNFEKEEEFSQKKTVHLVVHLQNDTRSHICIECSADHGVSINSAS